MNDNNNVRISNSKYMGVAVSMVDILDFKSNGRQADLSVVGSIPTHSRQFTAVFDCGLFLFKNIISYHFKIYNIVK